MLFLSTLRHKNTIVNKSERIVGSMFCVLVLLVFSVSCNKPPKTTGEMGTQRTFESPEDAGAAALAAAKTGSQGALLEIFGPEGKDVLFSGDAVKDKDNLQNFVAAYDQMHRWVKLKVGGAMLQIGADNYPFPIPLGENSSGRWYFDTAAGKDEILARRIGRDELIAIAACEAIANAQKQYFSQTHDGETVKQYALKFISDPDKHNGLYWPSAEGHSLSPLGAVGEFAKSLGYTSTDGKAQPFNGYNFKILTKQGEQAPGGSKDYIANGKMTGGFAVLAYPVSYRDSGIMSFIVCEDGVVYQKDLGENTSQAVMQISEYNPDNSWSGVRGM